MSDLLVTDDPAEVLAGAPVVALVPTGTVVAGYLCVRRRAGRDLLVRDDGTLAAALGEDPEAEVRTWRDKALQGWQEQVDAAPGLEELLALRQSLSWRVTRPLRVLRGRRAP